MKTKRIQFPLRIGKPIKAQIVKEAKKTGRSQNQTIINILIEYYRRKGEI